MFHNTAAAHMQTPALQGPSQFLGCLESTAFTPLSHFPLISTISGKMRVLSCTAATVYGIALTVFSLISTGTTYFIAKDWHDSSVQWLKDSWDFVTASIQGMIRGWLESILFLGNIAAYWIDKSEQLAQSSQEREQQLSISHRNTLNEIQTALKVSGQDQILEEITKRNLEYAQLRQRNEQLQTQLIAVQADAKKTQTSTTTRSHDH